MEELAQALESFNRKERNLLIRDALGHRKTPLWLSLSFRQRVSSALGIGLIAENSWWATDFHFSWLAGALAVYFGDQEALGEPGRPNPILGIKSLVEGTQEDIDLVIASERDLILIEAKAHGAWSNGQMGSKLERLKNLVGYHGQFSGADQRPIAFHLLLISPRPPQKLVEAPKEWLNHEGKLPWIKLDLDSGAVVRRVTRCNGKGEPDAGGDRWRILWRSKESPGWKPNVGEVEETQSAVTLE